MSASIRPTALPWARRARAMLAATVDLPTPPLPLAMAITCRMPGSDNFCCGPAPWGCMGEFSRWWRDSIADRLAQLAEVFERVDAGVVAVVPGNFVGVVSDRRHGDRPRRAGLQFARRQDAERIGRLLPLLAAGGAGAVGAEGVPGDGAAATVAPLDG